MRQLFIHHSFPEINRSRLIVNIVENSFLFHSTYDIIYLVTTRYLPLAMQMADEYGGLAFLRSGFGLRLKYTSPVT